MARVRRFGRLVLLFGMLLALVIPASAGPAPAGVRLSPPADDGTPVVAPGVEAGSQEGEGTPEASPAETPVTPSEGQPGLEEAEAVATSSPAEIPPIITMWYGDSQTFGALGNPQKEINVVGNVIKADTLSYRLNGGSWKQIAIGKVTAAAASQLPEGSLDPVGGLNQDVVQGDIPIPAAPDSPDLKASPRLQYSGDFNVEILTSALSNGSNTLELKAVGVGGEATKTVNLNYVQGTTWPLPYIIDWSGVSKLTDKVQVVDGEWEVGADGIKPKVHGYDRMVVLGDVAWKDFQVTVPVTIHSFPDGDSGGVGVVARWQGHGYVADEQPGNLWWNIGAYAFVLNRAPVNGGRRLAMYMGKTVLYEDKTGFTISEGKTYIYKLRVQTKEAGKSGFYSFRVWDASLPEPSTWIFEAQDAAPDELFTGSVGLLAHDAYASFGDVQVVPVVKVTTSVVGSGVVQVTPALVGQSDAYLQGDTVQLKAVPSPGWTFAGWSGDLGGTTNPRSVVLNNNLNVTATFVQGTARQLILTVAGAGEIDLDPPGPWYSDGQVVKLTPAASPGWEFDGWSGPDGSDPSNNGDGTWSLTMNEDKTLTGTFVKAQYALTTQVAGSGAVAKTPNQSTYEHGTVVEVKANPSSGWSFTGWSGDLSGTANPANVLMDGPKTVKAHFRDNNVGPLEYNNHTIDDDSSGGTSGNNNGVANCGETVGMAVGLKNMGTTTATGINAALSTDSLYVTWTGSSTSAYPNIGGGATQNNSTPFGFQIASNAPNGHTINFNMSISSANGGLQQEPFQVIVACAGSEGTVDLQVADEDDDAEERLEGEFHLGQVFVGGSDLELVVDEGAHQIVGVRFRNVTIPKAAAIAEAYLGFAAEDTNSEATSLVFRTQAADNPAAFTDDPFSISSRPKSTTSVLWNNVPAWATVGQWKWTPNLAPIVQEIVNRANWKSGNAMVFLVTGEGTRTAESYDGDAAKAPRLYIEYGSDPVCYSLNTSAAPAGSGAIAASPPPNCGGNKYIEGTTVTLTATANPGWYYTGWGGDLSGTTNPAAISMTSNKTVTANFAQVKYLLTINKVGTGTVTKEPDKAEYDYGEQVKLTATGTGGYVFAGWSGALSGTVSPAWVTMTSHKVVTAIFGQVGPLAYASHAIDDDATPPSDGNGDAFVDCGETVEMTVTLQNQGQVGAEGVQGVLSEADSYVTLGSTTSSSYGPIPGLGSAGNTAKFDFTVDPSTPHLHSVQFNLNVTASNGGPWPLSFSVPVSCLENAGKLDKPVVASSDDAEELAANGTVTLTDPSLELGQGAGGAQWVGLRFQNVIIPKGATIGTAYLEFTAGLTESGATSLNVLGEASDSALPFTMASQSGAAGGGAGTDEASTHNISSRPKTTAAASWPSVAAWSAGQKYKSPDLTPIIQEIVNRAQWKPGNALVLLVQGTGRRTAFSYDGDAALAPRLHVTFGGDLTCYTLTTAVTPTGTGTVDLNPGPNCGANRYLASTPVTLTPAPILDHTFVSWSGGHTGTDNPATIVMDGDKNITASFKSATCFTLMAGVNPAGTGTITPSPPPNCGGGKYVAGTTVQLQANGLGGYVFENWAGLPAPSAANPLPVVVDANKTVTANFTTCNSLTLIPIPANAGTVQTTPPPDCGENMFKSGTQVLLTAVPQPGFSFANWGGGVTGTENPTMVSVVTSMVVTASFEVGSCTSLSLRATPVGAGTVSADPPPDCEGTKYTPGLQVSLTATPKTGYKFLHWTGAATGTDNPTTMVVGVANTATAVFGLQNVASTIRLPILAR